MESKEKIILGVDPGTRITGYGIIKVKGPQLTTIDYGCIRPPSQLHLAQRYRIIFEGLEKLIDLHHPEAVAVELQFVLKNAQSAIKLGMAKAMVLLAAARREIPVYEYAPTKAKQAVVGKGQASKWQVQRMIQTILRLPSLPQPEDAADALALALCRAADLSDRLRKNQKINRTLIRPEVSCTNQFAAFSKKKLPQQPLLNAAESAIAFKSL